LHGNRCKEGFLDSVRANEAKRCGTFPFRCIWTSQASCAGEIIFSTQDEQLRQLPSVMNSQSDFWLFDGGTAGSGKTFDWSTVRSDVPVPMILAGGLTVENVAECVRQVQPQGVDVSSGVEIPSGSGVKDIERISLFCRNAKEACRCTCVQPLLPA